jgi:hypothetical protein
MSDDIELSNEQQTLLERVRANNNGNTEGDRRHSPSSVNEVQRTFGYIEGITRGSAGGTGRNQGRTEGSSEDADIIRELDSRNGPISGEGFNADQSIDTVSYGLQTDKNELNVTRYGNDDALRRKELNRQRQERYRDTKKQAQTPAVTVTEKVTQERNADNTKFSLRNVTAKVPLIGNASNALPEKKEEARVLTSKEAEEFHEKLAYIYMNGSGILDNLLEIVVNDHEEVTIWQLSEEEAMELAGLHVMKAKVSKEAAVSARKLVSLYDKMYFIMLLGPRVIETGKHVIKHKGLGFK